MSRKKYQLKTFIKWPGNKTKHLKHILKYIPPDYNRYIEPFIGSGALFLKLQPKKWIINDLNEDLIDVWSLINNSPEYIVKWFTMFSKYFGKLSNADKVSFCSYLTNTLNDKERSNFRTVKYMLMKYCAYMGNIISKNKYKFSGLDANIYVNNRTFFLEQIYYQNIFNVSEFLNETKGKIYNKDYKYILRMSKNGDFVFLDPPYIEKKYDFSYNFNEKLDESFLHELRLELEKLDDKNVKWLMTQANTKEVRNIFGNYKIRKFKAYRMRSKDYATELIITNY